jgi:hypothetical protein
LAAINLCQNCIASSFCIPAIARYLPKSVSISLDSAVSEEYFSKSLDLLAGGGAAAEEVSDLNFASIVHRFAYI